MPVNTYGFGMTDPAKWDLMRMDTQENKISSEYTNAKFDVAFAANEISTLKGGVSNTRSSRTTAPVGRQAVQERPGQHRHLRDLKCRCRSRAWRLRRRRRRSGLRPDRPDAQPGSPGAKFATPGTNFTVTEETTSAYLQYDLNTEILGKGVRANAGVRYYSTDLTSDGTLNTGTSLQPVSIKHKYNGWLPALNVAVDVNEGMIARFSANRDISRPALGDLAAAGSLTTAPFGGTISTGNPNLTPFTSDSIEGSLEFYDGKVGAFTIGVFYKKLKSFITTQTSIMPYSQTGFPLSFLLPGQDGSIMYNVSRPVNGPGADIQGPGARSSVTSTSCPRRSTTWASWPTAPMPTAPRR
jgi:iron complex outermembrane receptor protein